MPIPGSILGSQFPDGLAAAATMYPSLATLLTLATVSDTTGQGLHSFSDATDPLLVNIPCRITPLIQIRPQSQERSRDTSMQLSEANFQVNLFRFVNVATEVLATWQVRVDGVVYQILGAEFDGNHMTTRLLAVDVLLYNP